MKFETDEKRIFGLDLLRAAAIILVVLEHGRFILDKTRLEDFPFFKFISGVDIFFVLSGFLIGGILLKEMNKTEKFNSRDLFQFLKRRWFRTLPLYYLILAINYIFVKYNFIKEDIEQFNFSFITFTQNFSSPFYDFFWESWSLSIEEWFYILTPLLILSLHQFLPTKSSILIAVVIMMVAPLIYRYCIHDPYIDRFWWDQTFKKTVLCRLDSIGYGVLAAWLLFYYENLWIKLKYYALGLGIFLTLFILNFKLDVKTIYMQTLYISIVPFSAALFLPVFHNYKNGKGFFPYSIQHISKISYSMYLINLALVAEVIRDNFTPLGGFDSIIKYLIYWIIVIVLSSLIYKYFEKPILIYRDKKY